ncbi:MAG: hypothetical protein HUJ57_05195 [Erysipelotrichaceae bacterium]|nr:hypothetical protein [Erysipelotrichaceae bacterium]
MLDKLKKLLFEEEEIEDEYEEEEVPVVVKPKQKVTPIEAAPAEPVKIAPAPIVDKPKPVVEEPVVEEKPKLGIAVDELMDNASVAPKATTHQMNDYNSPVNHAPSRTQKMAQPKTDPKTAYEFTPVISPIFGVAQKDSEAILPAASKKKKSINDSKLGTVISPYYGINRDAEPDNYSKPNETMAASRLSSKAEQKAEEELPSLSLDQILANRRKEAQKEDLGKTRFYQAGELDKTIVMNSRNISLFDDDDDEDED